MTNFVTPPGRLVMGSLYKPNTTDADGNPLLVKSGPNMGQPKTEYFFALAIPKSGERHWGETEWGKVILAEGAQAFPQAYQSPTFAWKVVDGDSNVPNRRGVAPCTREGYPGNWVLSFKSGFAPRIYNKDGSGPSPEPDIKLGSWVQVSAQVSGNNSTQQPGVFLNHQMVAFQGYGPEIVVGPNPSAVGFGKAALPPGVSATPLGGMAAGAGPAAAPQVMPPVAAPQIMPQVAAPQMPPPNPAFLQPPAPAKVMTAAAQGVPYEQWIAKGWTDDLLRAHGYMQ